MEVLATLLSTHEQFLFLECCVKILRHNIQSYHQVSMHNQRDPDLDSDMMAFTKAHTQLIIECRLISSQRLRESAVSCYRLSAFLNPALLFSLFSPSLFPFTSWMGILPTTSICSTTPVYLPGFHWPPSKLKGPVKQLSTLLFA